MAGTQQSQEDLQKQNQINQEMQQQYRKMCMLQQAVGVIRSLDKKSVLDTLSKQVGPNIYCPNMMVSQQLTQKIVTLLNDAPELDEHAVKIQQILLNAISLTSAIRTNLMYSQGMSGMGMGMQQFGMNSMMGGMMNPMMMGMGMPNMMGPMMGGMNMMPGMGMGGFGMNQFGFNQFQQPQNTQTADGVDEATRKIQIAKEYVKTQAFQADPLIFLSMLSNQLGLNIDFSTDPQFEELIVQALSCAIQQMCMTNPMIFQSVYYVIQQMYMTDYYTKLNNGKGGNQQQANQFNPMMMGMNPMMMGMGMQMPGMMGGMMTGMDQNAMMGGMMNPMMMGMGMPNMMGPMMGGMNMMPGMTGTMGMPGMNNGSVGGTGGCIW